MADIPQPFNNAAPLIKIGHYTLGRTLGSERTTEIIADNCDVNKRKFSSSFLLRWNFRQSQDRGTHRNQAQSGYQNPEPTED